MRCSNFQVGLASVRGMLVRDNARFLCANQGLVAQIVGDKFGMGIDDTHMKLRGAPVLDEPALSAHQKMIADKLTVSELMTVAMIALPPVAKVSYCQDPRDCINL